MSAGIKNASPMRTIQDAHKTALLAPKTIIATRPAMGDAIKTALQEIMTARQKKSAYYLPLLESY